MRSIQIFRSSALFVITNLLLEEFCDRLLLSVIGFDFALGVLFAIDLLNDCLLITHFGHHRVSLLERFYKGVNSLVELVQIHLHVLLLGFEVFWLFVGIEIFKLILVIGVLSVLLRLPILIGRSGTLWLRAILSFCLVPSGVQILLLHKSVSPLEGSSLDVVSSLGEEFAQLLQDVLGDTHEDDVGHWLEVSILLVLRGVS